ncbi:hypothetical protein SODALDRAFT_398552 [Sodiomyces alkalinus F11]|uniref:NWD NACHT-NTPase N-terminal domain-containing protein n=1 Tax=Sodiomyces alkalinus (strain CBS 110278 / VKM F-3762 / F11) TaxID=1314773 RepID=A0A3N2PX68_SODAK|nr:hypothetical protein SODALDRAFT_398552 [Sodiomyces alkalinus F11]ROT39087.1 hypothetical protein SODALDRAFT_398552 [Sodiomyces alkalinus F11]
MAIVDPRESKSQRHIRRLVQKGQEKISRASRVIIGVSNVADFILSAKKIVDVAGVCLGLHYYALTEHLLDDNTIAAGNEFQAVLRQLEERVVELYKALLQYQTKSVYSYYRNQGVVFLRGLLTLDD